jgi:hypothetical protein
VSPRASGRTQECGLAQARARLRQARAFFEVAELVGAEQPDGQAMARDLRRLLGVKDDAHYGMLDVSSQRAVSAVRQAQRLLAAAASVVE